MLAAIVLAVVLVLGFWKPGFFVTTKLDVNKAQQGVQQILTDETNGYGAKNVKDVKCNNGQNPTVKKGDTFDCEVSIDGTQKQVTVTFQDDKGTYEVGRPAVAQPAARREPSAAARSTSRRLGRGQLGDALRVGGGQRQSVGGVDISTGASVATRTTGPAASM